MKLIDFVFSNKGNARKSRSAAASGLLSVSVLNHALADQR